MRSTPTVFMVARMRQKKVLDEIAKTILTRTAEDDDKHKTKTITLQMMEDAIKKINESGVEFDLKDIKEIAPRLSVQESKTIKKLSSKLRNLSSQRLVAAQRQSVIYV